MGGRLDRMILEVFSSLGDSMNCVWLGKKKCKGENNGVARELTKN